MSPISAPAVSSRTDQRPTPGRRRTAEPVGPAPAQARVAAPPRPAVGPSDTGLRDAGPRDGAPRNRAVREAPPRDDVPLPVPGPASGPVGGRAAARLERQAAEAAARKAGRRGSTAASTTSAGRPAPPRRTDDDRQAQAERAGAPGRVVQFAVAMVVVALVVLGVWTFSSPVEEAASGSLQGATGPQATASAAAPEAETSAAAPPAVPPAPAAPARAPVTVLNGTRITGLAAAISEQIGAGGWETLEPATYEATDVSITTVYYTEGDPGQEAAAAELIAQFPDISGPAPRFFEVPGVPDPGLVVVATGNWQP